MFERPQKGEQAILVQLTFPDTVDSEVYLAEFRELAHAAGATAVGELTGSRQKPDPKFFIGKGKAEELDLLVKAFDATLVLVNHALSPSQARNLEKQLNVRVIDRTGLILDIFATRAQTFEGKLQVELAQLTHLSTRLIRGWTHLERQKGGIGLRGPGETQLETDRRLIRKRIDYIKERLEKVKKTRLQNRRAREKSALKQVAIVGYTNAGKSTLFNQLTDASIFTKDLLFATLDTTMKKLEIKGTDGVILSDTVGFIRDLPHELIDAFKATLEETLAADCLIHLIDISDKSWREHIIAVNDVLLAIHADAIPVIQVFNKIDHFPDWGPKIEKVDGKFKVWIAASNGIGIDSLKEAISNQLFGEFEEKWIRISLNEASLRAKYYAQKIVLEENIEENGDILLRVRVPSQ